MTEIHKAQCDYCGKIDNMNWSSGYSLPKGWLYMSALGYEVVCLSCVNVIKEKVKK